MYFREGGRVLVDRVRLTNFRGVAEGDVLGFRSLNVLVGPNNSGKTTCLEAIALAEASSPSEAEDLLGFILAARGQDSWAGFSHSAASEAAVTTNNSQGGGRNVVLRKARGSRIVAMNHAWAPTEVPFDPKRAEKPRRITYGGERVRFLLAGAANEPGLLERSVSAVERAGGKAQLHDSLRRLTPALTDLRILVDDSGGPVLHVEEAGPIVWPASSGGDGFKRVIVIAAELALNSPLTIIEDPDAFLHQAALAEVARVLLASSQREDGLQLFVTTHNADLIRMLVAGSSEGTTDLAFFLMRLERGKLSAERFTPDHAEYELPRIMRRLGFDG